MQKFDPYVKAENVLYSQSLILHTISNNCNPLRVARIANNEKETTIESIYTFMMLSWWYYYCWLMSHLCEEEKKRRNVSTKCKNVVSTEVCDTLCSLFGTLCVCAARSSIFIKERKEADFFLFCPVWSFRLFVCMAVVILSLSPSISIQ